MLGLSIFLGVGEASRHAAADWRERDNNQAAMKGICRRSMQKVKGCELVVDSGYYETTSQEVIVS